MKLLISLTIFAACLAAVYSRRCTSQDDCKDLDRCCANLGNMNVRGLCLRFARKGARCSEEDALSQYYGRFSRYCPCQEGFSCKPYRLREGETDKIRIRNSLRCQKDVSTPSPETTTKKEPDVKTESVTVPEPETKPTSKPDPEPKTEPTKKPEPETEPTKKPEPETEPTEKPEPEPETEPTKKPDPEPEPEPEKPDENKEGPGGEHPRDDDCEDWTYGC